MISSRGFSHDKLSKIDGRTVGRGCLGAEHRGALSAIAIDAGDGIVQAAPLMGNGERLLLQTGGHQTGRILSVNGIAVGGVDIIQEVVAIVLGGGTLPGKQIGGGTVVYGETGSWSRCRCSEERKKVIPRPCWRSTFISRRMTSRSQFFSRG